jgi:hypothetical protein
LAANPAGIFVEAKMENVRSYRSMASMCRLKASLDPAKNWHWLARADRWESLVEAEIKARYQECNSGLDEQYEQGSNLRPSLPAD